ncbi:MAG: hypothetical protein GY782_03190 [Gammaproteobacteria bacterium]|nr:hypothetical protein [Gammaproteobacteria bacterium]
MYQPNCNNCLLANGMVALQKQSNLSNHYRYYYAASTHAQPISQMRYWPLYWCGMHYQALSTFNQCRHSETVIK